MKIRPAIYCLSVFLVLGEIPTKAAVYSGTAYEGFNYGTAVDAGNPTTDGNLASNNGGTGWNATGDAGLANTTDWLAASGSGFTAAAGSSISSGNLTSSLVPSAANRLTVSAGQATRPLGQNVDAGSLYTSFLIARTNDTVRTVNMAFFGLAPLAATATERFGFGQYGTATTGVINATQTTNGNFGGVFLNSNPANLIQNPSPIAMGISTTHLVIVRIDFNASGSNERVRVYVDPISLADETVLTPYLDNSGFDLGSISAIRPFAGGTAAPLVAAVGDFDEIRIGSTFAQVAVPEPGTTLLAGLSLMALWSHRRSRH